VTLKKRLQWGEIEPPQYGTLDESDLKEQRPGGENWRPTGILKGRLLRPSRGSIKETSTERIWKMGSHTNGLSRAVQSDYIAWLTKLRLEQGGAIKKNCRRGGKYGGGAVPLGGRRLKVPAGRDRSSLCFQGVKRGGKPSISEDTDPGKIPGEGQL